MGENGEKKKMNERQKKTQKNMQREKGEVEKKKIMEEVERKLRLGELHQWNFLRRRDTEEARKRDKKNRRTKKR